MHSHTTLLTAHSHFSGPEKSRATEARNEQYRQLLVYAYEYTYIYIYVYIYMYVYIYIYI